MILNQSGIQTYPVGLLQVLLVIRKAFIYSIQFKPEAKQMRVFAFRKFCCWVSYIRKLIRDGKWNSVANSFNGYLAEWDYPPIDPRYVQPQKCGHGWTRKRALRRLGKYVVEANLIREEPCRPNDAKE